LAFSPKEKFMAEAIKGLYRPRNPTTKYFYRLVEDHAGNLEAVYPEKYERVFGFFRPVVKTTMDRYLECGIYENGFARVRCGDCRSEYLVPFSMSSPSQRLSVLILNTTGSSWENSAIVVMTP
jgi:hypothetical protein